MLLADQAPQHPLDVGDHVVQVERVGVDDLMPAEGEELARQRGGAIGRLGDLGGGRAQLGVGRQLVEHQLAVAADHRQQVVEVVGHAAGQPADRLELLALIELRLETGPLVLDHALAFDLLAQLDVGPGQRAGALLDQPLQPQVTGGDHHDQRGGGAEAGQADHEEARCEIPRREDGEAERGRRRIDVAGAIHGPHVEDVPAAGEAGERRGGHRRERRPRPAVGAPRVEQPPGRRHLPAVHAAEGEAEVAAGRRLARVGLVDPRLGRLAIGGRLESRDADQRGRPDVAVAVLEDVEDGAVGKPFGRLAAEPHAVAETVHAGGRADPDRAVAAAGDGPHRLQPRAEQPPGGAGALEEIVARAEPQPPRRHLERRDRRHRHAVRGADRAQGVAAAIAVAVAVGHDDPAAVGKVDHGARRQRPPAIGAGRDVLEVRAVETFEMAALRLGFRRQHPGPAGPRRVEDLDEPAARVRRAARRCRARDRRTSPASAGRRAGCARPASPPSRRCGPGRPHARAAAGTPASGLRGGAAARCRAG